MLILLCVNAHIIAIILSLLSALHSGCATIVSGADVLNIGWAAEGLPVDIQTPCPIPSLTWSGDRQGVLGRRLSGYIRSTPTGVIVFMPAYRYRDRARGS